MTPNSGRAIEIFTEAIQLPVEERAGFLDRACGGDAALRQKIEALLRSNERAAGFLEQPAGTILEGGVKAAVGEKPGDSVGRYKLLRQIGEGGCGVVFMAEQEEPVRRLVALKVIKPGMDTKSVIARFEAERQALALMNHPNIAQVFDAGATASGRPYFVMELVEGVKITEYCDQHSLRIPARLELFARICDAIQHAHQKGIIHRDIKPSNILVTLHDGVPVPKVIDFGIAKATTGQQLTDKTIFTALEMLIGTPAYMSPEQAALTSGDVDTRTDIYSLGVLLYELLTGTTPFDTRELLKAGLDEVRRVIRNEEPVRPSTRLSTMIGADLVNISKHHGAEAPKLIREMRGDLDWIVMKSLEKDRARRYATANGLAMDITRYLSGDTVSARPPGQLYKLRKLVLRHKLGFAAFAIVMASLIAGLSVTTWSLAREKQEAVRSRQTTEIMKRMFAGVGPLVAMGRDTKIVEEILQQNVERINLELTNQPAVQADLRLMIAGVYRSITKYDKEEPLLRDALAFYRNAPAGTKLVDALREQALLHLAEGRYEKAEEAAREALAIETRLQPEPTLRRVEIETQLAWTIVKQEGRLAKAEEMFRKALATGERLAGNNSEQLLNTRAGLATALNLQNKLADAETLLRDSIDLGQSKLRPDHPYIANDMYRLAYVLQREQKLDQAESFARQCLDNRRTILGRDHQLYDEALQLLMIVLDSQGKVKDATQFCREQLELRRKRNGDKDSRVAISVENLAAFLEVSPDEVQFEQLASDFPKAWFWRAESAARHRRWTDALMWASKYLEIQPEDHEAYHMAAPLFVQTQDRPGYEKLCQKITAHFAGATDRYIADRMAKDCLILPRPGADLTMPAELAENAVTRGREDLQSLPYFRCCKALAEYRQGHWEAAAGWAQPTRMLAPRLAPSWLWLSFS
jgi:serine/threonine protein kinase/Flp pilus assembly protein TadD